MKEVLRSLLEAEEAGRQAAAQLEAAGEELLRKARAEAEEVALQLRAETVRRLTERELQAEAEIAAGREAIAREADAVAARLRDLAAARRPEAVARVVALLLGEQDA